MKQAKVFWIYLCNMVCRVNLSRQYRNSTLPLCKWTKHSQIALVIPGHEPRWISLFLWILPQIPVLSSKSKTHSSCEDRSSLNLYFVPQQLTRYSCSQLLAIRRCGRVVPSSYVLNSLKVNSVFRFRVSRG